VQIPDDLPVQFRFDYYPSQQMKLYVFSGPFQPLGQYRPELKTALAHWWNAYARARRAANRDPDH
jgi:hypothetical protein